MHPLLVKMNIFPNIFLGDYFLKVFLPKAAILSDILTWQNHVSSEWRIRLSKRTQLHRHQGPAAPEMAEAPAPSKAYPMDELF